MNLSHLLNCIIFRYLEELILFATFEFLVDICSPTYVFCYSFGSLPYSFSSQFVVSWGYCTTRSNAVDSCLIFNFLLIHFWLLIFLSCKVTNITSKPIHKDQPPISYLAVSYGLPYTFCNYLYLLSDSSKVTVNNRISHAHQVDIMLSLEME